MLHRISTQQRRKERFPPPCADFSPRLRRAREGKAVCLPGERNNAGRKVPPPCADFSPRLRRAREGKAICLPGERNNAGRKVPPPCADFSSRLGALAKARRFACRGSATTPGGKPAKAHSPRASRIFLTNAAALAFTSPFIRLLPAPTATAPALIQSATLSTLTPPVGMTRA